MGLHGADPAGRWRYLAGTVVVVALIMLLLVAALAVQLLTR